MYILGISAFYHDSAAALIKDGEIIAAAQEERFTRKKHDMDFPENSIKYCLEEAGIELSQIDYITFYDKPFIKFERLLETYLAYAPKGIRSFLKAMPVWIKEKLFLKNSLKKSLSKLGGIKEKELPPLMFAEHHQSHAASAFYPSPYKEAAVLCLDGVGEWATTTVWHGKDQKLELKWEIDFPHSLGLLYSAFTYYTGFKVNSGEYKLMGLAPYGEPKYVDLIYEHLIDLKDDGSFHLDMSYFNYASGLTMTSEKFHKLFSGSPRKPESKITQKEMDLAASIQKVTEEVVLRLCKTVRKELGTENLCMAGGVALNCVANGKVLKEKIFKNIWIQPAAGDAGGSLGAALATWHEYLGNSKQVKSGEHNDFMKGSYLGPKFSDNEIQNFLDEVDASYKKVEEVELNKNLAKILSNGKVVGWFQGRMEFGPRALGGRSIIGDARNTEMQTTMNLKIKYRESFRPFAPSILREDVDQYFEMNNDSPYMLLVAPVNDKIKTEMTHDQKKLFGIDKLKIKRSEIPAVTHVDYSARVQTVHESTNPRYYRMIKAFKEETGSSVIVNTSFNVRGEPIVCTPKDAYRCFMRTEMDYLVLENFLLKKSDQPKVEKYDGWKQEFELD